MASGRGGDSRATLKNGLPPGLAVITFPAQLVRTVNKTYTFGDLAKALNRSPVYLHNLQNRFELPAFEGAGYSEAYLAFLRTLVYLRTFGISEDRLWRLWQLEKKLLQLLPVDSTGSKTWFLDSCGRTDHTSRRLLLSNYDIGVPVPAQALQLGLNFEQALPELFAGVEMGEDALRVLSEYVDLYHGIRADLTAELPRIREAAQWTARWFRQTRRSERPNIGPP